MATVGIRMYEAGASAPVHGATNAPGFLRYNTGLAALGDEFCHRGWERRTEQNVELLVQPATKIGLCLTSASEGVAADLKFITARFQRGPAMCRRILRSQFDLWLPPEEEVPVGKPDDDIVYWLLAHTYANQQLLIDLIRPGGVAEDRRTIIVSERISVGTFGIRHGDDESGHNFPSPNPPRPAGPTIVIEPLE